MRLRAVGPALALAALAVASAGLATGRAGSPTDLHALPLGDGHASVTGAARGSVYVCRRSNGPGGAQQDGPWIHGQTFDATAKATVSGRVLWPQAHVTFRSTASGLVVSGNALPSGQPTGEFPIAPASDAYSYDRNPNSIREQSVTWTLPAPHAARRAGCLSGGPIGIALDGVAIFDALDAGDRDAVAHEVQDLCGGHPQQQGLYHYHSIPACLLHGDAPSKASPLVGYALDGYPIYGPRGAGGRLYTNADLDACHGHTVTIVVRGKRVSSYRYQATLEYPYTLGCYHGTPLALPRQAVPGGP
jgi:YHYH protein